MGPTSTPLRSPARRAPSRTTGVAWGGADAAARIAELKGWARSARELDMVARGGAATKAESAAKVLETLITTMELRPGETLTVDTLCAILEMGRTPVRDAVKQLEADGLLTLQKRTGIAIRRLENDDMAEIMAVRRALEHVATVHAIRNGTLQRRAFLVEIGVEIREAAICGDVRRFMQLGLIAYKRMLEAAQNEFLTRPLLSTYSLSRRLYLSRVADRSETVEAARLHHERFRAIAAGDEEQGRVATDGLMDFLVGFGAPGQDPS